MRASPRLGFLGKLGRLISRAHAFVVPRQGGARVARRRRPYFGGFVLPLPQKCFAGADALLTTLFWVLFLLAPWLSQATRLLALPPGPTRIWVWWSHLPGWRMTIAVSHKGGGNGLPMVPYAHPLHMKWFIHLMCSTLMCKQLWMGMEPQPLHNGMVCSPAVTQAFSRLSKSGSTERL